MLYVVLAFVAVVVGSFGVSMRVPAPVLVGVRVDSIAIY